MFSSDDATVMKGWSAIQKEEYCLKTEKHLVVCLESVFAINSNSASLEI